MNDTTINQLSLLSFIFPVYNEEDTLPHLRAALEAWLPALGETAVEIVLVNDGSADNSLAYLQQWAKADQRIKVVSFSRNFGHQAAVAAGLRYAKGDAVVIMDADLQDPLDVVLEMVQRYKEGYDIAYGKRTQREGETPFKLASAWLFYRIMRWSIAIDMPADTGDFRLVSRRCVDAVNAMPERQLFLRGLFAWSGFKQVAVSYSRNARQYGETKYPLSKMLAFAWRGITSFSVMPMRMVSVLGVVSAMGGFFAALWAFGSLLLGHAVQGWTSLMCLQAFLGGIILLSLGIIGEYIGKIYEEVKARPLYIVEQCINCSLEKTLP
ncbi:glycosyltransferase family 2 protein [Desulfovibrio cuneatus]|uniref:glycosyltransferase family 2 protein n=1 Tax=Desulfovibrio cuneatus TaxID=159728 RepID=UPI000408AFDB|nr:glycosyltransferase family 2 protein [Desulfovibrio cuneatus]